MVVKKLEIGCGNKPKEGYAHFDIRPLEGVDVVGDARKLPFKDGEFGEIYSRFFLEHLLRQDAKLTLKEMNRVLMKKGALEIIVPDIEYFCRLFIEGDAQKKEWALNKIYGFEKYPEDHHNFGYDFEILKNYLEEAGFSRVKRVLPKTDKDKQYLQVKANKAGN
ncbi:MAG: methyltransferase domain-containing protein [archaeon]